MANTLEILIASIALVTNSLIILAFFFLGNVMLAPIFNALERTAFGPQVIPITDMGYVVPSIWAILIIMEIVIIVAFVIVTARREAPEDLYGY
jgi:hypothetical protein